MIKANELRCGNLIEFFNMSSKPEIIEVSPRFFSSLAGGQTHEQQIKAGKSELSNYWRPIPITEEWLLRFGFKKSNDGIYEKHNQNLYKNIIVPMDSNNEVRISMPYGNGIMTIAKDIKYVHQL